MDELKRYRVYMHTTPSPGLYYYEGHVDVVAEDEDSAGPAAIAKARNGAFKDYGPNCFMIDRIERRF